MNLVLKYIIFTGILVFSLFGRAEEKNEQIESAANSDTSATVAAAGACSDCVKHIPNIGINKHTNPPESTTKPASESESTK